MSHSVIPDSHIDIVDDASIWHAATIGPDGAPQTSPVWIGLDADGNLCFSSRTDRQKCKNLIANPAIALSATDRSNPYRYLEVRGQVSRIDPNPGGSYVDLMAQKYLGVDVFPGHDPSDDPDRVIIVVTPESVTTLG